MKKNCMLLLITLCFSASFVCAQSDSDTDPNRWKQVKSWKGTFTFTSGPQDDVTSTSDPKFIFTSTARVTLDGTFVLDQKDTSISELYKWNGQGQVTGSIYIVQENKAIDGSSDCTSETKSDDSPLAPLVDTPGYVLQWDFGGGDQGKYLFEAGVFMIDDTVTQTCNGETFPPIYHDWSIGGASTISWTALPASGYNITGDAVALFNGWNNGHFHWDLEPAEFEPAAPACVFAHAITDTALLNILRATRNAIIDTPAGMQLVYLYYSNAAEVATIVAGDAAVADQFKKLIIDNTTYAQELIANTNTSIPCDAIKDVKGFLNELKAHGSTKLKTDIEWLLQGIEDTSLLNSLGIIVIEK